MIAALTSGQQRMLAIALLVVVVFSLLLLLIEPVVTKLDQYDETIDELAFRIKRYRKIIATSDQIFDQVEATRLKIAEQGYISTKNSEALVSAELQQFLKDAISQGGGRLISTQVLPSKKEGELMRIAVKLRLSGTIEMLRNLLYDIETEKPLLIIEQLDINPQRARRNPKTRKIEASDQLNISLMVMEYMRKVD